VQALKHSFVFTVYGKFDFGEFTKFEEKERHEFWRRPQKNI